MKRFLLVPLAVACLWACGPSADEDLSTEPEKPKPVAFEGKFDSRLVGQWRSNDGSSELNMQKDGALDLVARTPGRPGPPAKMKGAWLVNGERLLLNYTSADGQEVTIAYAMKISGDQMTLSTRIPKIDTVYKRR